MLPKVITGAAAAGIQRHEANTRLLSEKPEVAERIANKRLKTAAIMGAAAVAVTGITCATFFGIVSKASNAANHFLGQAKKELPHLSAAAVAGSTIKQVSIPEHDINVAQASGTGTAIVKTEQLSSLPVIGWLYDKTVASGTIRTATVTRDETLNISLDGSQAKLSTYKVNNQAKDNIDNYGIKATVYTDAFNASTENPTYNSSANNPLNIKTSNGWLNRILNTDPNGNRSASLTAVASQLADTSFLDKCAALIKPVITNGIKANLVEPAVQNAISLSHSATEINNLKALNSNPIEVIYQEATPDGKSVADVSYNDIVLNSPITASTTKVQHEIGATNVSIVSGNCTLNQQSEQYILSHS